MSAPVPPTDLEGHCSAIYDNTLYVLSPNSFLSLPLKQHAQWSKESMGVPVKGAACVQSDSALYVVGGSTSRSGYSGMQVYDFARKSWRTLPVEVDVLSGRTDHSIAYLPDTQQILSYAGAQPNAPSYLSSQTFLVSTQSPYDILAFTSEAPPGHLPIVASFNTSHAVMVGGSDLNTQIYTFGPSDGWQRMPTDIPGPLDPSSRATIIDGSDGSRVMEVYDLSTSPNNVTQIVLLGPGGTIATTGQTIGSSSSSRKRKRDLTLQNWPPYNSANAPDVTRTDCGVAQGPDGIAVISGGSEEVPVAIFNQDRNSWVDVDKFFDSKQRQQPLQPSQSTGTTTSRPTPATSSTPTSSTTEAAGGSSDSSAHDRMLRTLGITLGVLCGIAAIFIIVLLFLRWRKMKKRKQEGYLDEKNDGARMSFQDRGASFMKEAGGSVNGLAPPEKGWASTNNGSHSSLAIITGKFGNKRNTSNHEPKPSYDSTTPIWDKNAGTIMRNEPVEMVNLEDKNIARKPVPRHEPRPGSAPYGPNLTPADAARKSTDSMDRRKRSSGWSKYFATSHPEGPNGISHLPSGYLQSNKMSDASVYSNDRDSSKPPPLPTSILVPPLDIDFSKTVDGQRLSHVTSGSPAFNDSREDLARGGTHAAPQGQTGLIVDPSSRRSGSETISSYNRSTMSSNSSEYYRESHPTPWTPTSTSFKDHLNSRPPSSVYPTSEQRVPSRGKGGGGFFPGSGTSFRPSTKSKMGHTATPSSDWASPAKNAGAPVIPRPAEDRDSSVTVFPKGVPSAYYAGREREAEQAKPVNSDLGWLNLGLGGPGGSQRI
jgi:hypothetical protein